MVKRKTAYQPAGAKGARHFSVTVPTELLKQANARAKKDGISRSYLTTKALREYLAK